MMNIPSAASLPTAGLAVDLQNQDSKKLGSSCREFEATLWRQVLEKALTPLLSGPMGSGSTGNGTYTFFLSNTIAERVSGQPHGFSSVLQARMAAQAQTSQSSSDLICTPAATR